MLRRRPNFAPTSTILLLGWRISEHKPSCIPHELFVKMGSQFNTLAPPQGDELAGVLREEIHVAFMLVCVGWGARPGRMALV